MQVYPPQTPLNRLNKHQMLEVRGGTAGANLHRAACGGGQREEAHLHLGSRGEEQGLKSQRVAAVGIWKVVVTIACLTQDYDLPRPHTVHAVFP